MRCEETGEVRDEARFRCEGTNVCFQQTIKRYMRTSFENLLLDAESSHILLFANERRHE